jgi:hypothetical protein
MKILILLFTFIVPVFSFGQNNGKMTYKSQSNESDAEKSYRTIGRNNFALHLSGDMGRLDDGAMAFLFSSGYEKNFGRPEKNGYFFSGELRAKTGKLMDIRYVSPGRMEYASPIPASC